MLGGLVDGLGKLVGVLDEGLYVAHRQLAVCHPQPADDGHEHIP